MSTRFYGTDLTDAAWAFVAPVLPAAQPGGRPRRTTNLRAVLNAIFYLPRTGCQWRLLPHEFPPCGSVYQISGVWVHLHRVLYEQARRHAGRAACPSVVIMDGQSVKTAERGRRSDVSAGSTRLATSSPRVRRVRRSVCSIALLLVCLEWKPNSYDYRTQLPSFPKLQRCPKNEVRIRLTALLAKIGVSGLNSN